MTDAPSEIWPSVGARSCDTPERPMCPEHCLLCGGPTCIEGVCVDTSCPSTDGCGGKAPSGGRSCWRPVLADVRRDLEACASTPIAWLEQLRLGRFTYVPAPVLQAIKARRELTGDSLQDACMAIGWRTLGGDTPAPDECPTFTPMMLDMGDVS